MAVSCKRFLINRIAYRILRPFAYLAFFARYRMRFSVSEDVKHLDGSMILLGNHVNKWDPFLAAIGLNRQVHFIASDFVFRQPALAALLRLLGAIPKIKFRSDMGSLRALMELRNCGSVIGIFPEGHVNWAGETMEIVPSTGKLIRLLKAPVVSLVIRGGYISRPRWKGRRYAPGEEFEYRVLLTPDEIKAMTPQQITSKLQNALYHNEWDYLREHPRPMPKNGRAETLERSLFLCPSCSSYSSLKSSDNDFYCETCGARMHIGKDGFPCDSTFPAEITDPVQWDRWQQSRLEEDIRRKLEDEGGFIFSDDAAVISQSSDGVVFDTHFPPGRLEFYGNRIVLNGEKRLEVSINEFSGIGVQNSEEVEFYLGNTLGKFAFNDPRVSAYKWYSAMNQAQKILRIFEDI